MLHHFLAPCENCWHHTHWNWTCQLCFFARFGRHFLAELAKLRNFSRRKKRKDSIHLPTQVKFKVLFDVNHLFLKVLSGTYNINKKKRHDNWLQNQKNRRFPLSLSRTGDYENIVIVMKFCQQQELNPGGRSFKYLPNWSTVNRSTNWAIRGYNRNFILR